MDTNLYNITYILWLGTEFTLNRMFRVKGSDRQHADGHSLPIIWFTLIPTVFLAQYISAHYSFPLFHDTNLRATGLVVIYIGLVLRVLAVMSLGKLFTVQVTIRQDHQLKTTGLYRILRHPNYFAVLLCFAGFGISLNNWVSLLLIMAVATTLFIMRIRIEEKVLVEQFGDEYLAYKKRTKGLIPFVW